MKDDDKWHFIWLTLYLGIISYVVVVLVAFLRDLFRRFSSRSRSNHQTFVSVRRWYGFFRPPSSDTRIFYYVEFARVLVNLSICALYVVTNFQMDVRSPISTAYRVFTGLFILDMLNNIISVESAISHVFSISVFVDAFTYPTLILVEGPDTFLNFSFLRAINAYCAIFRLHRRVFVHMAASKRLIFKLVFQCIIMFFVLAASIQLLEVPGDLLSDEVMKRWEAFGDFNFINACYFIIVTLSTVGYGDFSPLSIQGKIFTLFIIIVGIVVFTSVISELVEQASRRRGSGSFTKNAHVRHVIVTGTPTLTDLVHFVSEFYSDARKSNLDAKVVVMVEEPQWTDTEWFQHIARNHFLQSRLRFLMGSVRNSIDLSRAKLSLADAVFILTSPSTGEEPSVQDTRTVMNILAVRNTRMDIPIYAQTLLEDSSLQTDVALSTAPSFSRSETYCRDELMHPDSQYSGLFCKVMESEFRVFPKLHKEKGFQCFDDVLKHHLMRGTCAETDPRSEPTINDLSRSQHVCLQEVHMALIAGNLKANGIGTLLSNMYLDVPIGKSSKEDPPWLTEYHMGAVCNLAYAIVPENLNGVCIKEIALDLFHIGVIIIATSDPIDIQPKPVLGTDMPLMYGDLALVLTYHEIQYIAPALHIVGLRYAHGELRHKLTSSTGSVDTLSRSVFGGSSMSNLFHDMKSEDTPFSEDQIEKIDAGKRRRGRVRFTQEPDNFQNLSGDDLDALAAMALGDRTAGGLTASDTNSSLPVLSSSEYIPRNLKDHIIIAMEGDAPLGNVPLLLRNLWTTGNRRSLGRQKKVSVVVVHPAICDTVRQKFSRFERVILFFVEGSTASRATWRRAKLNTAKAVATVADYTKPWSLSDARTIFTLLTLDVTTRSDHDLFICSELVDEKSLEFLREPSHARRRGASLGEAEQISSPLQSNHRHPESQEKCLGAEDEEKTTASPDDPSDPDHRSRILSSSVHAEVPLSRQKTGKGLLRKSYAILPHLGKGTAAGTDMSGIKGSSRNLRQEQNLGEGQDMSEPDPASKPGAARARRGTLFSRSRYASGELLVHSSAITLLVREYIEPGFVKFFTNLLGTEREYSGMKIRLVRIPSSFFETGRDETCRQGRKLVRYNIIFKALIRIGVTPLGIYRSGVAPVLLPSRSRKKRGPALFDAVHALLEKYGGENDMGGRSGSGNGFFEGIFGLVREVVPSQMQDELGRQELQGDLNSSSSSVSDDEAESTRESESKQRRGPSRTPQRGVHKSPHSSIAEGAQKRAGSLRGMAGLVDDSSLRNGQTWLTSPRAGRFSKVYGDGRESPARRSESFEVSGQVKYTERTDTANLLPYVFTLPDPNTWCSENDAIFLLCDPSFDLPRKWCDTSDEK